jgi:hypothetical protein
VNDVRTRIIGSDDIFIPELSCKNIPLMREDYLTKKI